MIIISLILTTEHYTLIPGISQIVLGEFLISLVVS